MEINQTRNKTDHCLISWLFIIILFVCPNYADAQLNKGTQLIDKTYIKATRHFKNNSDKLKIRQDKAIARHLDKFIKHEEKLQKKLCNTNPQLADRLFSFHANPLFHTRALPNTKGYRVKKNNNHNLMDSTYVLNTLTSVEENDREIIAKERKQINEIKNHIKYLQDYLRNRKTTLNRELKEIPEYEKDLIRYDKANYYFKKITDYNEELFSAACSKFESDHLLSESLLRKMDETSADKGILEPIETFQTTNYVKGMQNIQETEALIQSNFPNMAKLNYSNLTDSIGSLKSNLLPNFSKHQFKTPFTFADVPEFKINPLKHLRFIDRLKYSCLLNPQNHINLLPTKLELQLGVGYMIRNNVISGISVSSPIYNSSKSSELKESQNSVIVKAYGEHHLLQTLWLYFAVEGNTSYEELGLRKINPEKMGNNKHNNPLFDTALIGLKLRKPFNNKSAAITTITYDFINHKKSQTPNLFEFGFGWEW